MQQVEINTFRAQIIDADNSFLAGDLEKAVNIYQELIKSHEDNSFLYNKLGQVYAKSKNWQQSIDNYRKALTLGIEAPFWTYKNLGDALREAKEFKQAISAYQQGINIDSSQPDVYDGSRTGLLLTR